MKKIYILALVALSLSTKAQTTYFTQNFDNPDPANLTDFTGSATNQFDAITAGTVGVSTSSASIINKQLVIARNANAGIIAARTTNFSTTATGVYQMTFDFASTSGGTAGQFHVALGTGFSTGIGVPGTADSYLQLRFNVAASGNGYTITLMNSGGTAASTSTNISGTTKTIRYVMNSIGSDISYTNHLSNTATLLNNTFDLYVDDTLVFDDLTLTAATKAPTNFKIAATAGTGRGTTTFDNFQFNSSLHVVPVKLISFDGKSENNAISLNWKTASETNSDYFEVLKLSDIQGSSTTLGTVKSTGNSSSLKNYTFRDYNPKAGVNYYQLKQVDFDGTTAPSSVIAVNNRLIENIFQLSASSNDLTYMIDAAKSGKASLEIFSLNGQKLLSKNVDLREGLNTDKITIANFENGIFIARLTLDRKVISKKFVK
jgi:hypothetical protein